MIYSEMIEEVGGDPPHRRGPGIGDMVMPEPTPAHRVGGEDPFFIYIKTEQGAGLNGQQGANHYTGPDQIDEDVKKERGKAQKDQASDQPSQEWNGKSPFWPDTEEGNHYAWFRRSSEMV